MKQFTSILLAITILFLNIGFSISNHYCDGELSGTAVTLWNKDLNCEMQATSKSDNNSMGEMSGSCGMTEMVMSCEKVLEFLLQKKMHKKYMIEQGTKGII